MAAKTKIFCLAVDSAYPSIIFWSFFHCNNHSHPSILVIISIVFQVLLRNIQDTLGMLLNLDGTKRNIVKVFASLAIFDCTSASVVELMETHTKHGVKMLQK